ncbi:hypothetical protein SAMN02745857_03116 [Andreprevotia lacus DSM 23236]|uniref:Uncharacterized protein n=1 Tax=Andreprevotia lacus DSM 23236 TaxID=1121001 RepID=A0A1W1XVZ4_9NEIS|nr:hypothetical protein SAMN02745857_03116 [Andreprevotia lacus DSM 23236]
MRSAPAFVITAFKDRPIVKPKLVSRLVAGAFLTVAASCSMAGQIVSGLGWIARESITTDAQAVTAPKVGYIFIGDIDARLQDQTIQIQFTLGSQATWATPGLAASIVMNDGVTGQPVSQGSAAGQYSVVALGLSADYKTMFATITVHSGTNVLVKQPVLAIAGSATAADNPQINHLKTVIDGLDQCDTRTKSLQVSFKHYIALSNPAALATDATAVPDEHVRAAATNTGSLLTFSPGIFMQVEATPAAGKLAAYAELIAARQDQVL